MPKKLYPKKLQTPELSSACRLCKAVVDKKHCRDLFKSSNRAVLSDVQEIFGGTFQQDNSLSHLICRLCERRLKNGIQFKRVIEETQKALAESTRSKRCAAEFSPSVERPPRKSRSIDSGSSGGGQSAPSSRRTSLDFTDQPSHTHSDMVC